MVASYITANVVRDTLENCGIKKPALAHVEMVARRLTTDASTHEWTLLFSEKQIHSVVQNALTESEVISSIHERMELMKLEDPTPEMGQQLNIEWLKVLGTLHN